jgi:DNA-binding CsgD family transcriptional regulator
VASVLQRMAVLAAASGLLTRALRLAGAASAQRMSLGMHALAGDRGVSTSATSGLQGAGGPVEVAAAHSLDLSGIEVAIGALSSTEVATAIRDGFQMGLEQAMSYAAFAASTAVSRPAPREVEAAPPTEVGSQLHWDGALANLTTRERDVAQLLLHGMTNRQIGQELMISERTAETHVCRILRKLKIGSRAQLAAWIMEHQGVRHIAQLVR